MVQRLPRLNSSIAARRLPPCRLSNSAAAPRLSPKPSVSLLEMACRVTFRAAHDLPDDGDRAAAQLDVPRPHVHHQAAIDPTHLHHHGGRKEVEHDLLSSACVHPRGPGNRLASGFNQDLVARRRENRCIRIVGNGDRHRARGMGRTQGGDREGSRAARRDTDDDIVGTDLCGGDGLRACGLVVLGPFDAANECVKTAGNNKDDPVSRPVIGWRQFASVLHPDTRRRAGTDIDDASATPERWHRVLDSCGD